MARSPTTTDAFNAVAEPARRKILTFLAGGERSVNEVAESLGVKQPQASKHLKVLKAVGLVTVRDEGTKRLYRLQPDGTVTLRRSNAMQVNKTLTTAETRCVDPFGDLRDTLPALFALGETPTTERLLD